MLRAKLLNSTAAEVCDAKAVFLFFALLSCWSYLKFFLTFFPVEDRLLLLKLEAEPTAAPLPSP